MPFLNYFHLVLLGVCGYALVAGKTDERAVAITCLLASLATRLLISPITGRYSGVEMGVALVDVAAWAAFTVVALRSERFWPLWISGLQLTTSLAHILKTLESDLFPIAYAAAGRFWVYPILIILAVGTWRHQARDRRARTPAPS